MNSEIYKYRTILSAKEFEFKEKGSKFIGLSHKCTSANDVKEILVAWRILHPKATHLCYAYKLGVKGEMYRANDDGEPSNSAGAPILGQIDSFQLTNVLVGVIRYYGGTKLGVGGLISSYKMAAKGVLEISGQQENQLKHKFTLRFAFDEMPKIMDVLRKNRWTIEETIMAEFCELTLLFEPEEGTDWQEKIRQFDTITINDLGLT